jgi:hypothetical protein
MQNHRAPLLKIAVFVLIIWAAGVVAVVENSAQDPIDDGESSSVASSPRPRALRIETGRPPKGYAFGRADFPTGLSPSSIATGDFNGDGKLDLAIANQGAGTVSVLLGRADGTFAPKVDYTAGAAPSSVAIADFNRDGVLDIAVTTSISNSVAVLLGNGDGTFRSAVGYGTGANPVFLSVGDFNGDKKLDLAIANQDDSTVSILLGNGDGTFQTKTDYSTGQQPTSIVLGDFNHDGRLDLAVTAEGSNTVSVLLGNGDGTFQSHRNFATASQPVVAAVIDFNKDGNLDLAVATKGGLSILLGNGNGTFQPHHDFLLPVIPTTISVRDFNRDGLPDVALGSVNPGAVAVLLGKVGGGFQAAVQYPTLSTALATADINGDGYWDIAAVGMSGVTGVSAVSILLGDGQGNFNNRRDYLTGVTPVDLATGDFNADGNLDLAVVNQNCPISPCRPGSVSVLLGKGNGTFTSPVNYVVGTAPWPIGVGDFNGDHKLDLAVGNYLDQTVSILLGVGDGRFQAPADYPSGEPNSMTLGDFNLDGNLDVALGTGNGGFNNPAIAVMLGNGNGSLHPPIDYPLSGSPGSVISADFNKDGKLDLANVNFSSRFVSVWLGNGDGTFRRHVDYASPGTNSPQEVRAGDFNRDGNLDLAVLGFDGGGILLGKGDGTFHAGPTFAVGGFSMTTGDFNRDGILDLFVPGTLLFGNGDGTFSTRPGPNVSLPTAPVAADFNHDGNIDLAVVNESVGVIPYVGGVSVFLNNPSIALFPTKLAFGSQRVGTTSRPLTLLVSNPSIVPLKLYTIVATGDYAQTNDCPISPVALTPGTHCVISVTFTPTRSGVRVGSINLIDTSLPGHQSLALIGTGY